LYSVCNTHTTNATDFANDISAAVAANDDDIVMNAEFGVSCSRGSLTMLT